MGPAYSDLVYFLEVANTSNISRAAERLGITQPSLSLAIKRTENSIGTQLLIRSKSGVKLTKAGERFIIHSRSLLLEWNKIKHNTLLTEQELTGSYSIGSHTSVALYTLPHTLPNIYKKHPNIDIHLNHDLSRKITENVISFKIDVGIVVNPTEHPDLIINKICTDKVQFWAHKNWDKSKEQTLIYDPDLIQSQSIIKKLKKKSINVKQHIKTSNLELIRSLIEKNMGIGILPGRVAGNSSKKLLQAIDIYPFFNDEIYLIHRMDCLKTQAEKQFLSTIKAELKNHF